jgi:hypothetical protein
MPRKSETPEALKAKQQKAMLRIAWRVVIGLVVAYTLAKYFKVPLPF